MKKIEFYFIKNERVFIDYILLLSFCNLARE